jgi:DNA repair protein SbcD/Mre11
MSSLRVLHFADLHVGMENYGKVDPETGTSSRIRDFLDRLDEIVNYALSYEADLVIFAGDAFKTRDPDPTQQREFAKRIKQISDEIPVFMLVGNHDIPGMAAKATSIDIFRALDVKNIIVGRQIGSRVVETRRGPVFLGWVPFPVRGRLLAQEEHKGASVETLDKAVESLIIGELADLTRTAAEQNMPRVLVGHFSVGGAAFGSERSVMLGRDLVVPKSSISDPVWDYTALGHIHKHQNLTANEAGSPPVVYSGSLERIDFGEEVEDKGFCWINLERGKTTWEFIKVNARPFITLRVDGREEADPTTAVIEKIQSRDLKGAIVRVNVKLREAQVATLREREIEKALRDAEVNTTAAIAKDIDREVRSKLGDVSPETLTPAQLVEKYFIAKGRSVDEAAQYAAAAQQIFTSE